MFSIERFSDRLTEERKRLKLTQENVADVVGVHKVTQNNYESGKRQPDAEYLHNLSKLGFDVSYILQVSDTQKPQKISADVVMIPRYSVRASAGNGASVLNEEPIGYMAFMREWIERHELDATALFVIGITGDSMEGKLYANDSILVNRKIHDISGGSVYVFRQDNDLLIKYLQRMPGDVLRVSSENQAYPPYDIDMNIHADSVEIIGQVAVSMHSWI